MRKTTHPSDNCVAMATPTTLNDYYSSIGQALPSLSARSSLYSSAGLGGGYTGTAAQNTALLGKLVSSGGAFGTPSQPSSQPSSPSSSPSGGSVFGTGIVNVDNAYQPVTDAQAQIQAGRQALLDSINKGQNDLVSSFQNPADQYNSLYQQFGLPDLATAINTFKNQIRDTSNQQADLPNVLAARAAGTFATADQVNSDEGVQGKLLNSQLTQLGNNLDPILTAYNTGVGNVNNIVSATQQQNQLKEQAFADNAARQVSGYDTSAQERLDSLIEKVNSGIQLTTTEKQMAQDLALKEQEYQTTLQAAKISAGATTGAATIGAEASKQNAALANPGVAVTKQPNGTYTAALPSYLQSVGSSFSSPQASTSTSDAVRAAVSNIFK